jgi:putative endopeptidase
MSRPYWIAVLAAGALLSLPAFAAPDDAGKPVYGTFGFDTAGMDRTVKPGDDFYAYASGTWQQTTEIPADAASYGYFKSLADLSLDRTRLILDEAAGRSGNKAGDFYASFMDEAGADAKGAAPVRPWIAAIAAATDRAGLAAVMARLQRQGVRTLFGITIEQDDKNPERYVAQIGQGGLGLPDRDFYLKDDPKLAQIRAAYPAYLATLLTLAGQGDADPRAANIAAFEARIAQDHWSRVDSRDMARTYNLWSRADLEAKAPGLDWSAYLGGLGLDRAARFQVTQPSALSAGARLWGGTPLPVLKDVLIAHVLTAYANYLSKPFVDANFAFSGQLLSGTPENPARWKRGASLVSEKMGEAIGKDYVARYFPPGAKQAVDRLVRNVIAAYRQRLETVAWMAPETRAKAQAKLAAIVPHIGYPETWREYSALEIRRNDLVGNVARAEAFEYQRKLNQLGRPVDRSEWPFPPMTVNASIVDYGLTEIVFPAAILQAPFFDPDADPAVNYGAIGQVIGHELSHHFDDQGGKYDPTGKLSNWWTAQDIGRFKGLTDGLVRQYDAYEPIPGIHIQGALTLGENVADLAGLTVAHQAYRISLGGNPAPLIDGFTGDQRFYLGFAQIYRLKIREPQLRRQLLTSVHSPSRYRAYAVRNQDAWYEAFDVDPGEAMFLATGDRVRIW